MWTPWTVLVDDRPRPGWIFRPVHPEDRSWAVRLRHGPDRVTVGAIGVQPSEVGLRTVRSWNEYGIDLSRPQPVGPFDERVRQLRHPLR